ncbi:hypothetical protein Tco_0871624, partial [Tanacetum coccineum]
MNPLLMFASPTLSASEMTKCVCVSIWNHSAMDVVCEGVSTKCVRFQPLEELYYKTLTSKIIHPRLMLLRCHRSLRCRYPLRATIRRLRDDGDNESRMRVLERLNNNFLNLRIREYCPLFKLNARFLAGQAMMTSTTNNALFRGVPRRASQPRHTCGCSRLGQGQQHRNQFKRNQVSNPSRSFTTKHKSVACPADADCSLDIWLAVSGLKVRLYSRVEIIPNEHDIKITRSCVLLGVTLDCCFATLYAYAKRLMGSGFSDSTVQKDIRSWPFIVVEGYADNFCPHGTSCKNSDQQQLRKHCF